MFYNIYVVRIYSTRRYTHSYYVQQIFDVIKDICMEYILALETEARQLVRQILVHLNL
jgi:hypothetical protein